MSSEKPDGRTSVPAPDPVDAFLREGLAPRPDQVRRVVRHALSQESRGARSRSVGWRFPAAVTAMALLALGFAALSLHQRVRDRGGTGTRRGSVALITNASGEVELVLPGGVTPGIGRRPEGHARGVVEVFNRDGCVAAVLPEGRARYLIIGGDT